jgi:pantoate--beta-alanine ligase
MAFQIIIIFAKFFMEIIQYKEELKNKLSNFRRGWTSIGFVPTMGALHEGHRSLMTRCKNENNVSICSIFVNPNQFNNKNDLKNYPRNLEKDLRILEAEKFDFVFCPDEKEMYPEPDKRIFEFGKLGEVMEGKHRPGHFNGVAQIVTKLFNEIEPTCAYFGEKDFQQLTIVKYLVRTLNIPVNIISCPTVRESDGLAMSSRNLLLNPEERKSAPSISQTLYKAVELQEKLNVHQLTNWVIEQINISPFLKVEYFEIVNDMDLQPVTDWEDKCSKVGCIAVNAGTVRLIDNIRFR